MSIEELPSYPNLLQLSLEKIEEISISCVKSKHLEEKESLLDVINETTKLLESKDLIKEDIYINHRNMYLLFNHGLFEELSKKNFNKHKERCNKLFKTHLKGKNWTLQEFKTKNIIINGQYLIITCITWGGAEECPIEKYFDAKKYHGYDRGGMDWFVTNLDRRIDIWIPDLLPAQVGMFGFCQGRNSKFRLDLHKYIDIMNMKSHSMPLLYHYDSIWEKSHLNDTICNELNTDFYYIEYDEDEQNIRIVFKKDEFLRNNKEIKLFGAKLLLESDMRIHKTYYYLKNKQIVLD
jgi:hypothetical protein